MLKLYFFMNPINIMFKMLGVKKVTTLLEYKTSNISYDFYISFLKSNC